MRRRQHLADLTLPERPRRTRPRNRRPREIRPSADTLRSAAASWSSKYAPPGSVIITNGAVGDLRVGQPRRAAVIRLICRASMLTGVRVSSERRMERFWSARGQSTPQPSPSPLRVVAEHEAAELKSAVEVGRRRKPCCLAKSATAASPASDLRCADGRHQQDADDEDVEPHAPPSCRHGRHSAEHSPDHPVSLGRGVVKNRGGMTRKRATDGAQNENLTASCTSRGGAAATIWPNVGLAMLPSTAPGP